MEMVAIPAFAEEFGIDTEITEELVEMLELCAPKGILRRANARVEAVEFMGYVFDLAQQVHAS